MTYYVRNLRSGTCIFLRTVLRLYSFHGKKRTKCNQRPRQVSNEAHFKILVHEPQWYSFDPDTHHTQHTLRKRPPEFGKKLKQLFRTVSIKIVSPLQIANPPDREKNLSCLVSPTPTSTTSNKSASETWLELEFNLDFILNVQVSSLSKCPHLT